jgi:hypothetical protein
VLQLCSDGGTTGGTLIDDTYLRSRHALTVPLVFSITLSRAVRPRNQLIYPTQYLEYTQVPSAKLLESHPSVYLKGTQVPAEETTRESSHS